MNETKQKGLTRRSLVLGTAAVGAGLTIGVYFTKRTGETMMAKPEQLLGSTAVEWDPQAFVRIGRDNSVTVFCKHTEMGQGIYTGMATVVAEELDASWAQMKVHGAPADAALYSNLYMGEQFTGGSQSLTYSYDQLRQVAAATRQMLVDAAASDWKVAAEELSVIQGNVRHDNSDRSSTFGELADAAMEQAVPQTVTFKSAEEYNLVGTDLRRVDIESKTNGSLKYTQDLKLPGMLTAVVAHAPRFGVTLRSFDGAAAKAMDGVVDVVAIPTGVAVIAIDFWTATRARDHLSIEWDESNAFDLSSEDIVAQYKSIAETAGTIARDEGSITDPISGSHQTIEAEFEFPFLAHAPLEPMNCIVKLSDDSCEIWNAAQQQTRDQKDASKILGISPDHIMINQQYAGGAFGRRANKDYMTEAVEVAKAANRKVPIKLVWTREDDMQAGQYRPLNYHRLHAGLDANGHLVAWHHRLVGQSIAMQEEPTWIVDGVDSMSVHGADDWLYEVANIRVETHSPELPVPVLWYRGTGATHTVFAVETVIDEAATLAGRDPVEYRMEMLKKQPRMTNVLQLVTEKADWGSELGPNRGRGISICSQRGTYLAQVVEVSTQTNGTWTVDRVIAVIDCGLAINPDNIRAQMEGGIGFGLSSTLGDAITFRHGYVEQSNFNTYRLLRINQMPQVDVHIVPSDEHPTGIGELPPMVIGAAVANALFAATGQRHRRLPIGTTT